jgi:hypothetical protein
VRRPEFLAPAGGLTTEVVCNALRLAMREPVPPAVIVGRWTEHERMLAYDWAMREHLRASDSLVRPRPQPWFVARAAAWTEP